MDKTANSTPATAFETKPQTPVVNNPFSSFNPVVQNTQTPTAPKPSTSTVPTTSKTTGKYVGVSDAEGDAIVKRIKDAVAANKTQAQTLGQTTGTTNAGAGMVASSSNVIANEKSTIQEVLGLGTPSAEEANIRKTSDDYIKFLQDRAKQLDQQYTSDVASIEASFQDTINATKKSQERETATTRTGLQRIGGFLGESASAIGALNNLAETHKAELASLEVKKQQAIQKAREAVNDKQFELARMMAKEAKDVQLEIQDRRDKFFTKSLQVLNYNQDQQKQVFDQSVKMADKIGNSVFDAIQGMDSAQAVEYIRSAANDIRIDPNLLLGKVSEIQAERAKEERSAVIDLAKKFVGAQIDPEKDTFESASQKVRNSREYKVDILRSESALANSLKAARDTNVDYSNPFLKMYTQATGEVVSSPSEARGIMGYANSLLSGKEVVSNDFKGTLTENQIRASDAEKLVSQSFSQLNKKKGFGEVPDSSVWQYLASPESSGLSDEEKKTYIMQIGKDPADFGIY